MTESQINELIISEGLDTNLISDGYHTFRELYNSREAYNAALFREWAISGKYDCHKSWRHYDGELCFGGGWFVVIANLPSGQITNHYPAKSWKNFQIPETESAKYPFDGHKTEDVIDRILSLNDATEHTMSFSEILVYLKSGRKVARKGWNGKGMYCYIVPANTYPSQTIHDKKEFGDTVPYLAYYALKTAQNDIACWTPSVTDTLAEDWVLVE